jgi:hypothetical protein
MIALPGPSGDELRNLLAPIEPAEFVREYWAQKSLFVKGFAGKYRELFDAETFSQVLAMPGPVPVDFLRASFDRKTPSGASAEANAPDELRSSAFRATPEQAVPLYDAGATLCVSQIESRVPRLVPFAAAIKRQLGYPGTVSFNAYLSPPGSGYNWHFDGRIASTLQIEGTKTWRFSRHPAIAWPRANGSLRGDGTVRYADAQVVARPGERLVGFDPADVDEVLLEPGDLLVLPAGVWHEACGGSGGSLALNLSFSPVSYTQVVHGLLDALLLPDAAWRGPAPLAPGEAPGTFDDASIAAIGAQLARAAEALGALRGDSPEVVRVWSTMVQSPAPGLPPRAAPRVDAAPVQPDRRLRVRRDGNFFAMPADGGTRLLLTVGPNRELELTGAAMHFVRRILAERSFLCSACAEWTVDGNRFPWSDVQEILTSLEREGLLEEATSEDR